MATQADIESRVLERERQRHTERVRAEGFEITGLNPADGDTCQYRLQQKVGGRWKHAPCGEKAVTTLEFAGPSNPDGLPVPLCKKCVGRIVKDLVGYLDC